MNSKVQTSFEREKHVYPANEFAEIIKDTIRFFNGTPVHKLPPPESFVGAGVYALYYITTNLCTHKTGLASHNLYMLAKRSLEAGVRHDHKMPRMSYMHVFRNTIAASYRSKTSILRTSTAAS